MPGVASDGPVYALNLFDIADREEYLAYSRRSAEEVARHGGRVVALGKFSDAIEGDIQPREALILVEWKSRAHFDGYRTIPRWPISILTAKPAAARTSGTSSTGSRTCGRCCAEGCDRGSNPVVGLEALSTASPGPPGV